MSWTVYEHITPSGKRYIGITSKKPENRWHNGRGYRNNKLFSKAIEKYGWNNIQHNIISTNLTEKEAKWLENYLICYYWTFVCFKDCKGYNCTLGGDGQVGFHHTKETKEKISESNKGKIPVNKGKTGLQVAWNKGIPSPFKGIPKTDETKIRISESSKGKNKGKTPWNKGKTGLQVAWNKGIPQTEESKIKMRESHKGKHWKLIDGKRVWY